MNNVMKKIVSVYGLAYFVLLMIVLGLLYAYPKLELHLLLNSYHTGIEDSFFKYYSMLAEGPLYVLALLPLFWKKIEMTILFALSELSGGRLFSAPPRSPKSGSLSPILSLEAARIHASPVRFSLNVTANS